ncbi:hypothetical protein ACFXM1_004559 [Salmonella enterica]
MYREAVEAYREWRLK